MRINLFRSFRDFGEFFFEVAETGVVQVEAFGVLLCVLPQCHAHEAGLASSTTGVSAKRAISLVRMANGHKDAAAFVLCSANASSRSRQSNSNCFCDDANVGSIEDCTWLMRSEIAVSTHR